MLRPGNRLKLVRYPAAITLDSAAAVSARCGYGRSDRSASPTKSVVCGFAGAVIEGDLALRSRDDGPEAWLALIIVAVPVLAFVWFLSVATLRGALGDPL